jgi:hypothetical protein
MAVHQITTVKYYFNKPVSPITEIEYLNLKNSPINTYPKPQNPLVETFKNDPGGIIMFICLSWTIMVPLIWLITGQLNGNITFYKMIKKRNDFNHNLYDIVYKSDSYDEFKKLYEKV